MSISEETDLRGKHIVGSKTRASSRLSSFFPLNAVARSLGMNERELERELVSHSLIAKTPVSHRRMGMQKERPCPGNSTGAQPMSPYQTGQSMQAPDSGA